MTMRTVAGTLLYLGPVGTVGDGGASTAGKLSGPTGIDVFSVGSELNSTEDQADRWRHIVDRVRARFPGRVTYTANWDRYDNVTFWQMVDFISVSSYFELSREDPDAPVSRLTLDGAGHTWPGGMQYLPKRWIGRVSHDVDGATLVWDFVRTHQR